MKNDNKNSALVVIMGLLLVISAVYYYSKVIEWRGRYHKVLQQCKQLSKTISINRTKENDLKEIMESIPSKVSMGDRILATHAIYSILEEVNKDEEVKISYKLIVSLISTESNWKKEARGSVGEIGYMQIRPETAGYVIRKLKLKEKENMSLYDPYWNIKIGILYLRMLVNDTIKQGYGIDDGSLWVIVLNKYNLGHNSRFFKTKKISFFANRKYSKSILNRVRSM